LIERRYAMIDTADEYEQKLSECKKLMENDVEPGSEEGMRLVRLVDELEDYEKTHFPIGRPTP